MTRDPAESPRAAVDPFASLDFDQVEEVIASAFAGAVARWPGDLTRAAADFSVSSVEMLKGLLREELSASYREGVVATIAYIIDAHPKRTFIADCIAFASNLHALQGGLSETEIAERHGVKRATVCKWVQIIRGDLSLPKSRGMKDDEAKEVFRDRAHRTHGTERQPKPVDRIATLESVTAQLCRALSKLDIASMPKAERASIGRILAPLKPALQAVGQ